MEIEKLIELVKNKPVLYNKNHKSYRKNEIKVEIWRGIGKELDISGEKCKYKWKCLRTQYTREKEMRNALSGSGPVKKKVWKYFEMMQFIDDFLEPRATHTNIGSSKPIKEKVFEAVNLLELDDTMEAFEEIFNNSLASKRRSKSRERSRGRDAVKGDSLASKRSSRSRERSRDRDGGDIENIIQNLITEITRVDKEADDEVDLYFKSIAKIVKGQKLTSLQFLQLQGKLTLTLKTELENMQ